MRLPSPNQMIQCADLSVKQIPVQEQDGAQRLRLSGSAHALFQRQVIEKVIDLCRSQFIRLPWGWWNETNRLTQWQYDCSVRRL